MSADLERRLRALEEVEAIKRLKYRYWRFLDLKQWDDLASLFAADATVAYGDGKYTFTGVDSIMDFLRRSLGWESGSITLHHGHHPEIELLGDDAASGIWALYNYMFRRLTEASFERDTAKLDEVISLMDYERETWTLLTEKLAKERNTRPAPAAPGASPQRAPLSVQG